MKQNQSEASRRSVPTPANAGKSLRLPLGKRFAFAAIALLAGMAILEGVLALVGVQPLLYEKDPYVGFSSQTPLFGGTRALEGGL